jgi:hypothetical protein
MITSIPEDSEEQQCPFIQPKNWNRSRIRWKMHLQGSGKGRTTGEGRPSSATGESHPFKRSFFKAKTSSSSGRASLRLFFRDGMDAGGRVEDL